MITIIRPELQNLANTQTTVIGINVKITWNGSELRRKDLQQITLSKQNNEVASEIPVKRARLFQMYIARFQSNVKEHWRSVVTAQLDRATLPVPQQSTYMQSHKTSPTLLGCHTP